MKIAFLTSSYPRFTGDGIAPFIRSIAEALVKSGHKVDIIAPYDPQIKSDNKGELIPYYFHYLFDRLGMMGYGHSLEADVKLKPLVYLILPFFLISAIIKLWQITGEQKSEIIYAHWVIPNGLAAAIVSILRRKPLIISLHGSDIFIAKKNFLFRLIARWIFHRASCVTACSPDLKNDAVKLGAPESNTILLPWGADPEIFRPSPRNSLYRQRSGLHDDDVTFITLGRLVYKKGFDRLIRAFGQVLQSNPHAKLVIGGGGPLRNDFLELVKELGISNSVNFAGQIEWNRVPEFLNLGDIFALPSIRDENGNVDGLPTVLLEAMSCGLAVIASDIGGVRLAIQNGDNGILVPPFDINSWTREMNNLVSNPELRNQLGCSARRAVETRLNWDVLGKTLTMFLDQASLKINQSSRIGSIYREAFIEALGKTKTHGRVLDIGCHDGYFLEKLPAFLRVGIDLDPKPGKQNISFVRADACHLPFANQIFDYVFCLDLIEHLQSDKELPKSISRVISPHGCLLLTTPNKNIKMPFFLTKWVSRKWGHIYRLGYSINELKQLFREEMQVAVSQWNGSWFRGSYLFLRVLLSLNPNIAEKFTRRCAILDSKHLEGNNGFLLLEGTRYSFQNSKDNNES